MKDLTSNFIKSVKTQGIYNRSETNIEALLPKPAKCKISAKMRKLAGILSLTIKK